MKTKTVERKTFEEKINERTGMYLSSAFYLKDNKMEYGAYFKKHNGENWLIYLEEDGGFIGEPMENKGWFCYEFDKDGTFKGSEPMFYNDLHWCINGLKGII